MRERIVLRLAGFLLIAVATCPILTAQKVAQSQTAGAGKVDRRYTTGLTSGQPATFFLPAVNVNTILTGDFGYQIVVPQGATRLDVAINTATPGADVDLYVRYGNEPLLSGGRPIADYISETLTGVESISVPNPREGNYFIGFGLFTLNTAVTGTVTATVTGGSTCTYSLSTSTGTSVSLQTAGGSGTIAVTAGTGCAWTASSDAQWLTIPAGAAGNGNGTISYNASQNGGVQRVGRITVANQSIVFTQLAAPTGSLDGGLTISQFVNGGGWTSTIFLTNISNTAETLTINFYSANGAVRRVPILGAGSVESITLTLAGGETAIFEAQDTGDLQGGWAVIVPATTFASRLSGFAVFRSRAAGRTDSEAVVPLGAPARRFMLLFDNAAGFETGFALANPSNAAVSVVVTIRNEAGAILGTDRIDLAARAQTAVIVSQRFPQSAGRRGSFHFSASPTGVVGLGLRFSPFQAFTSFPALTSPDILP